MAGCPFYQPQLKTGKVQCRQKNDNLFWNDEGLNLGKGSVWEIGNWKKVAFSKGGYCIYDSDWESGK